MSAEHQEHLGHFELPGDEAMLNQLQQLAILFHARGKIDEAQELVQFILELKSKKNDNDAPKH